MNAMTRRRAPPHDAIIWAAPAMPLEAGRHALYRATEAFLPARGLTRAG
jgi:hypothetical protein